MTAATALSPSPSPTPPSSSIHPLQHPSTLSASSDATLTATRDPSTSNAYNGHSQQTSTSPTSATATIMTSQPPPPPPPPPPSASTANNSSPSTVVKAISSLPAPPSVSVATTTTNRNHHVAATTGSILPPTPSISHVLRKHPSTTFALPSHSIASVATLTKPSRLPTPYQAPKLAQSGASESFATAYPTRETRPTYASPFKPLSQQSNMATVSLSAASSTLLSSSSSPLKRSWHTANSSPFSDSAANASQDVNKRPKPYVALTGPSSRTVGPSLSLASTSPSTSNVTVTGIPRPGSFLSNHASSQVQTSPRLNLKPEISGTQLSKQVKQEFFSLLRKSELIQLVTNLESQLVELRSTPSGSSILYNQPRIYPKQIDEQIAKLKARQKAEEAASLSTLPSPSTSSAKPSNVASAASTRNSPPVITGSVRAPVQKLTSSRLSSLASSSLSLNDVYALLATKSSAGGVATSSRLSASKPSTSTVARLPSGSRIATRVTRPASAASTSAVFNSAAISASRPATATGPRPSSTSTSTSIPTTATASASRSAAAAKPKDSSLTSLINTINAMVRQQASSARMTTPTGAPLAAAAFPTSRPFRPAATANATTSFSSGSKPASPAARSTPLSKSPLASLTSSTLKSILGDGPIPSSASLAAAIAAHFGGDLSSVLLTNNSSTQKPTSATPVSTSLVAPKKPRVPAITHAAPVAKEKTLPPPAAATVATASKPVDNGSNDISAKIAAIVGSSQAPMLGPQGIPLAPAPTNARPNENPLQMGNIAALLSNLGAISASDNATQDQVPSNQPSMVQPQGQGAALVDLLKQLEKAKTATPISVESRTSAVTFDSTPSFPTATAVRLPVSTLSSSPPPPPSSAMQVAPASAPASTPVASTTTVAQASVPLSGLFGSASSGPSAAASAPTIQDPIAILTGASANPLFATSTPPPPPSLTLYTAQASPESVGSPQDIVEMDDDGYSSPEPGPVIVQGPSGTSALPSYEDMIIEGLTAMDDPHGTPPRTLFHWMEDTYPLMKNFRPSASQALQKAYKRGRLLKTASLYRINRDWDGNREGRKPTRRPQVGKDHPMVTTGPDGEILTISPVKDNQAFRNLLETKNRVVPKPCKLGPKPYGQPGADPLPNPASSIFQTGTLAALILNHQKTTGMSLDADTIKELLQQIRSTPGGVSTSQALSTLLSKNKLAPLEDTNPDAPLPTLTSLSTLIATVTTTDPLATTLVSSPVGSSATTTTTTSQTASFPAAPSETHLTAAPISVASAVPPQPKPAATPASVHVSPQPSQQPSLATDVFPVSASATQLPSVTESEPAAVSQAPVSDVVFSPGSFDVSMALLSPTATNVPAVSSAQVSTAEAVPSLTATLDQVVAHTPVSLSTTQPAVESVASSASSASDSLWPVSALSSQPVASYITTTPSVDMVETQPSVPVPVVTAEPISTILDPPVATPVLVSTSPTKSKAKAVAKKATGSSAKSKAAAKVKDKDKEEKGKDDMAKEKPKPKEKEKAKEKPKIKEKPKESETEKQQEKDKLKQPISATAPVSDITQAQPSLLQLLARMLNEMNVPLNPSLASSLMTQVAQLERGGVIPTADVLVPLVTAAAASATHSTSKTSTPRASTPSDFVSPAKVDTLAHLLAPPTSSATKEPLSARPLAAHPLSSAVSVDDLVSSLSLVSGVQQASTRSSQEDIESAVSKTLAAALQQIHVVPSALDETDVQSKSDQVAAKTVQEGEESTAQPAVDLRQVASPSEQQPAVLTAAADQQETTMSHQKAEPIETTSHVPELSTAESVVSSGPVAETEEKGEPPEQGGEGEGGEGIDLADYQDAIRALSAALGFAGDEDEEESDQEADERAIAAAEADPVDDDNSESDDDEESISRPAPMNARATAASAGLESLLKFAVQVEAQSSETVVHPGAEVGQVEEEEVEEEEEEEEEEDDDDEPEMDLAAVLRQLTASLQGTLNDDETTHASGSGESKQQKVTIQQDEPQQQQQQSEQQDKDEETQMANDVDMSFSVIDATDTSQPMDTTEDEWQQQQKETQPVSVSDHGILKSPPPPQLVSTNAITDPRQLSQEEKVSGSSVTETQQVEEETQTTLKDVDSESSTHENVDQDDLQRQLEALIASLTAHAAGDDDDEDEDEDDEDEEEN